MNWFVTCLFLGNTPLHVACELGLLNQIEMLTAPLEQNEDPGFQTLSLPQGVNERNYSGELCLLG